MLLNVFISLEVSNQRRDTCFYVLNALSMMSDRLICSEHVLKNVFFHVFGTLLSSIASDYSIVVIVDMQSGLLFLLSSFILHCLLNISVKNYMIRNYHKLFHKLYLYLFNSVLIFIIFWL